MWGHRGVVVALVACIGALMAAGPAQAGRVLVTGHDVDLHCSGSIDAAHDSCHYMKVAVDYVRAGSTKPVLVLDKAGGEVGRALDNAYGAGVLARDEVDPVSPAFGGVPLSPANYSAIIVASDTTCGGCDLNSFAATPDSDAINARTADIAAFFNGGGGVLAFAGADHADGNLADGPDNFYNFVPIPVGGVAVSPPFTLTPAGTALGFADNPTDSSLSDINCCPTHNSFTLPPAGSELKVAETDSAGRAETLFADGTISGGKIVSSKGPPATAAGTIKLPSTRKCVSRRHFPIHLRAPRKLGIETAVVFVNGKRAKTVRNISVKADVDLRGLPKGRFTVKVTLVLSNGKVLVSSRQYRTCVPKRKRG